MNYSWYNSHNVTAPFVGGLGNQLFQYASMYGIAKANGFKSTVPKFSLVSRIFPQLRATRTEWMSRDVSYKNFIERQPNAFDGRAFSLNFMHNIYLDGYLQSWRYFDHVRTDLRKQLHFPQKVLDQTEDFLQKALLKHRSQHPSAQPQFIGVHVRRGDFLSEENRKQGYVAATAKYFDRAMRYFESRFKEIVFIVTSDDPAWCQENIGSDKSTVVISSWMDLPSHDMCLLSKCNHTIVSVGTFGWWGAWLAGGDVTYFKDFPQPQSNIDKYFKKGDYYLPNWIAV
ncbi:hypothetical protein CAPTEDRAFT_99760 [Capitella teleta]|uniref:L-Fucosyltransferase n=1 Tax=Capitella teleta TaxID=283909 RepID=R7V307_CAPTE|nr:hypothetical protein CAPTEDRAFT_99760 [Capitella teleta]|eukprot:ELU10696.1 hypothetical protein CAPTEDRAFT_99760 [Capitella teleta]